MAKSIKKKEVKKKVKTKPKTRPKIAKSLKIKKSVKDSFSNITAKVKKVFKKNKKSQVRLKPKKTLSKKQETGVKLERSIRNPIIQPRAYSWESKATFNPTAFEANGKVHLIYRAVGEDDVSVLGYASSFDGYNIHERPTHFIYKRSSEFVKKGEPLVLYGSGGGWCGGCEDPRIALIDNILYMIYVAFDGWSSVRMALTSIKLEDFKNKKWDKWENPVFISPPGEIHKNWVLFPEKINGKFALMHSFYPKILVDYFDTMDHFDGKNFLKSDNTRPIDKNRKWDSWFRGVGPTPIKTKDGWLVLYHAMDHTNPDRYKMGALLLDLKDPTRVLYRSEGPILEPEEHYENHGHKWGVIYSCGAVVKDERLFVYYGGADKVVCVASIILKDLLDKLKQHKTVKLQNVKILEKNNIL